jgi:pimeloyl-ACP methyl ester carboxylesterase
VSRIEWVDTGSGPVVVLLHAFPCDRTMWDSQVAPMVEAGWRVLVPDLPGFGRSDVLGPPPTLAAVVESLAASLLQRSIDRCVLVGLSVGGYLIMEWLRRHPEMVAAIVLCDTKAGADSAEAVARRLDMSTAVKQDPSMSARLLRERLLPVIVGKTTLEGRRDVVETVTGWMEVANPSSVAWYQEAMAARLDSMDTLRESQIPALILWGEEDELSPREDQDAMLSVLRDARLAVIPQAGHLCAVENPGPVTQELLNFLAAVRRVNAEG